MSIFSLEDVTENQLDKRLAMKIIIVCGLTPFIILKVLIKGLHVQGQVRIRHQLSPKSFTTFLS